MSDAEILQGKERSLEDMGQGSEPTSEAGEGKPAAEATAPRTAAAEQTPKTRARMIDALSSGAMGEQEMLQATPGDVKVLRPAPPARALARTEQPAPHEPKYPGFGRAMGILRGVLPVVQKVLPLLEGNVPLTVANLLAPTISAPRRPVNLEPMEHAIRKMHAEHLELQTQVTGQAAAMKLLGEQVEALKQLAVRNAEEQDKLATEVYRLRRRLTVLTWVSFALLVASLGASVTLILRAMRVIP
ncbi:MAG TPA: hypothetical protein VMV57_15360 [Terracidiphilus sp.]|nr:hypothetical protein [Terracidiphilus sp.]